MLRHFKMEMLKRQQEELLANEKSHLNSTGCAVMPTPGSMSAQPAPIEPMLISAKPLKQQPHQLQPKSRQPADAAPAAAVATTATKKSSSGSRSRRASKPQMEKRRRARINECLDILKSYVLTDSTNLVHLGIDPAASENQDEETIARTILKSSGLIYRHRGRKNPNKLEKADILELTVDYVRRLHEQRNNLLVAANSLDEQSVMDLKVVPAHLSEQLTLDLSPKTRAQPHAGSNDLLTRGQPSGTPLTPPPSSASSIQSIASEEQTSVTPQMILSRVLNDYKLYENMLPYQSQRC